MIPGAGTLVRLPLFSSIQEPTLGVAGCSILNDRGHVLFTAEVVRSGARQAVVLLASPPGEGRR